VQVLDDYAQAVIRRKVKRLLGKDGVTAFDRADLEQELVLGLLEDWPRFDPAKAHRRTFVYRVIQDKAASMVRARRRFKRGHGLSFSPLSDGQESPGSGRGSGRNGSERLQLALDTAEVVSRLTTERQDLCVRLKADSIAEVARQLKISRSAVYSRLRCVRPLFESSGMREYLASA